MAFRGGFIIQWLDLIIPEIKQEMIENAVKDEVVGKL